MTQSHGGPLPHQEDDLCVHESPTSPSPSTSQAASAQQQQACCSPVLCQHTGMLHLCTGCSQQLYAAVQQCLRSLATDAEDAAAVLGLGPDASAPAACSLVPDVSPPPP